MRRIQGGILGTLFVLTACGEKDSGLPQVKALSPEGANHQQSRFSPDGGRVVYWTPGAKGWELTVAAADLTEPNTLATNAAVRDQAAWSPDGASIAFGSDAAGIADVAVVSASGGEIRRLTDSPGFEIPFEWHPRGDRVTYLATASGGTFSTLTVSVASGISAPVLAETRPFAAFWSPDGSRIAYNLIDKGKQTIWVADSTGRNSKQLTTEGLEVLTDLSMSPWSPDGSELLYVSRRTGTGDIWVLPVNGGAPRQLTRDVRDDNNPTWSRDGKWVAFISTRGRQTDVWVVPGAGGKEIRITDDAAEETNLQWVGKRATLAFQTGATARTLLALTVETGKERRITPDSIRVGSFDVSQAGDEVVYQVLRGGGVNDLQVASLAGGAPRTLVAGSADNSNPQWSPDGKSILFESNRSGNADIWVVPAAGGDPRQLTNWPTNEGPAAWAADGASVYFVSDREATWGDVWSVPAAGGEPHRETTDGSVNTVSTGRSSKDVFGIVLGGKAGQFVLTKLLPDGKLQTLWDRGNVFGVSRDGFTAKGDSVVITTELPTGGRGSYLISTQTGQGRQILGKDEFAGDFSPDGTQLSYSFGSPNADLGVLNVKDGTTRRLTNTPENEGRYRWTRDGKTIVVNRTAPRSRIAVTDLTSLLARANP